MEKIITEWTSELRYLPYEKWNATYKENLKKTVAQSKWRLAYHIQPETGLLNDPNGFSYFNGKWQLFYQSFPFGGAHGLKSWAHLTSTDLVHWEYEGLALKPDTPFDSHGVYSGSALPIDDQLFLFYTGNVRDKDWTRHAYQNGAWMDTNGTVTKIAQPLFPEDPHYTDDFRDPMIFPYNNGFAMVIGAKNLEGEGKILTYFSADKDVKNFKQLGELTFTTKPLGYMVECPNLVFIDNKPLLLFCPQGLDKNIKEYDNIFPNMYVVADEFDIANNELINPSSLANLDEGFDVYATQAFNAPDGRALAVSWIGLPDITYPTDTEGWSNCLSLVKELTLKNGELFQYPVSETLNLRQKQTKLTAGTTNIKSTAYELAVEVPAGEVSTLTLFANEKNSRGLLLTIDTNHGKITLDRSNVGIPFAEAFGHVRTAEVSKEKNITVNIFADTSVIEIYINQGERTLTGRFFPDTDQTYLHLKNIKTASFYHLERTNN